MGCCLIAVIAAFAPRIALLLVWVFTPYVSQAFHSFVWPLLGLIFLPFTTLLYALMYHPGQGVLGWGWFWVALGLFLDISNYTGGYGGRSRYRKG